MLFLGGTAGENKWRDSLIPKLVERGVPLSMIYNPIVPNWNQEAQEQEEAIKASNPYMIYYLADPKQSDLNISGYSLVEATMGLYDNNDKTAVIFDTAGMTGHSLSAMQQAEKVLRKRFPDSRIYSNVNVALDWLATLAPETVQQ